MNAAAHTEVTNTVVCKRCGIGGLAWVQSRAGKWYLVAASKDASTGALVAHRFNPHRCADPLDAAHVEALADEAERSAAALAQADEWTPEGKPLAEVRSMAQPGIRNVLPNAYARATEYLAKEQG